MEIRLLGAVEVWADGRPLDTGGMRQRAVLAALAMDANRGLPVGTVVDRVWGADPPPRARQTLHAYVARLRKIFRSAGGAGSVRCGAPVLGCRGGAYMLEAAPSQLDVTRLRSPQSGGSDQVRAAALRQALSLWRGEPLAGLSGSWAAAARHVLTRTRLELAVEMASLEMRRGGSETAVRDLTPLLAEYPGWEPLVGMLMRALRCAGNDSEALRCYAGLRRRLADELGCEPCPQLQRLHVEILRDGRHGKAQPSNAEPQPLSL